MQLSAKVFHCYRLYFTILVHGEVPNDDGCGVSWCYEWYTRGRCIAWGYRNWVSWSNAHRTGGAIVYFTLLVFGLCWQGSRSKGLMLLLKELQLERTDLNYRVRVDFALRGAPGSSLLRVTLGDSCILALSIWWPKEDMSQAYVMWIWY